MTGVAGIDADQQLEFVESCCAPELVERQRGGGIYRYACEQNQAEGFGPIEADFLYCFVRTIRPPRIVQVGCGVSTAVCELAARDAGYQPSILCVDPYPTDYLRRRHERSAIQLVQAKVETCELDLGKELADGGLFFVDSSHVLGPAGEVTRLILELLPTLPKGAWAHFHDITFPYDYARDILSDSLFFSHETPLLHAYLAFNSRVKIAASLSMLHHTRAAQLRRFLPNYEPASSADGIEIRPGHYPSSAYLLALS